MGVIKNLCTYAGLLAGSTTAAAPSSYAELSSPTDTTVHRLRLRDADLIPLNARPSVPHVSEWGESIARVRQDPAPQQKISREEQLSIFTSVTAGARMQIVALDKLTMNNADAKTYAAARKAFLQAIALAENEVVAQMDYAIGAGGEPKSKDSFEDGIGKATKDLAEASNSMRVITTNIKKRENANPKDVPAKAKDKKQDDRAIEFRLVYESAFERILRQELEAEFRQMIRDGLGAMKSPKEVVPGDIFGTFPPTMRKEHPGLWETIFREKRTTQAKNIPAHMLFATLLNIQVSVDSTKSIVRRSSNPLAAISRTRRSLRP